MSLLIDIAHTFQHLSEEKNTHRIYKWPVAFDGSTKNISKKEWTKWTVIENKQRKKWTYDDKEMSHRVQIQHKMCGLIFFLCSPHNEKWKKNGFYYLL